MITKYTKKDVSNILYVINDAALKYKGIIPCGIRDKGVTNLREMGVKNYNDIEKVIIKKFLNTFL